MEILVTGSCGFIGQKICERALKLGWDVVGVDILGRMPDRLKAVKYFCAKNNQSLSDFLKTIQPDYCVHAAGMASVGLSFEAPDQDFAAGPILTFTVLDALRRARSKCRFVFLSSAAVYGEPSTLPVSERAQPNPISPYGFHKLQSEIALKEFALVYQMQTASVRIFSAYGVGLKKQVLWDLSCRALADNSLTMRGTGQETRDFINVEDVVGGVFKVLENGAFDGRAYNLASGKETSIRALAELTIDSLGLDIKPAFDGFVPAGDPQFWRADISAISSLGFEPTVSMSKGIGEFAAWVKSVRTQQAAAK